ncbi:MAG: S-adenosylmethionine decarboxylase family protein [Planctomycetota bacterium]
MPTGYEWIVDATDCLPQQLQSGAVLRAIAATIIAELDLHVVGEPLWHQFPDPGGWTGLYLLSESHLTVHTFPERGVASWNLYCCRPRPDWNWERQLAEFLGARKVVVRRVARAAEIPPGGSTAIDVAVARHDSAHRPATEVWS